MKVEKTEVWITCSSALELNDGRAVRGFFGNLYMNRPEFHGHWGDKLIYKHPLIQYKVFGGSALLVGLKEGAYLLKALPELDYLEVYHQRFTIIKQDIRNEMVPFGLTENMMGYTLLTPWIGLNGKNYQLYLNLRERGKDTHLLMDKIITGNILSMSKSVGYEVTQTVSVSSRLQEDTPIEVKKEVKLISFKGTFEANFVIPNLWGIGGKVSLGHGTVRDLNGGKI